MYSRVMPRPSADVSEMLKSIALARKKPANGDDCPDEEVDDEDVQDRTLLRRMSELAATHGFNEKILETYQACAIGRKSTLIFCASINYVDSLTSTFQQAGIEAKSVSSLTPKDERADTVATFRNGESPVLVDCKVFLEGADLPRVGSVTSTYG
jgi:superfamily II DNA or RNA helicase